jgi:glycosyltransferase involved in cell wall biosynthesis
MTQASRRLPEPAAAPIASASRIDASRVEAVVCIPTFRRPDMLATTLASLEAQATKVAFAVVVVDNDAAAPVGLEVAQSFFRERRLSGVATVEARQGNVHAINAAFRLARERYPSADYFLMIDDDERAEPQWLDEMVACARQGADIVGGPVTPIFPEETRAAYRDHPVFWPAFGETGPVPIIYGTGNCLLRREVFDGLAVPSLDPSFNFLGGGDTEFFTRCRRAGFTFFWRQEAQIYEQVTPGRLALGWVLRRSLATGAINYSIDRLAARSLRDRLLLVAKNIALGPVSLHRALRMLRQSKHPLAATHPIGIAVGRLLASVGAMPQTYRYSS